MQLSAIFSSVMLLIAVTACGERESTVSSVEPGQGGKVVLTFPELPETADARSYLSILLSAPKFEARNSKFQVDAMRIISVGPVSSADYDVQIELRRTEDGVLKAVKQIALTVTRVHLTDYRFPATHPIGSAGPI